MVVLAAMRVSVLMVVRGAMEAVGWVLEGWAWGEGVGVGVGVGVWGVEGGREARWRDVWRRRAGVSMRRIRGVGDGWT